MKHDTAQLIGTGGMGEVYRAWDPDLKRHVALKYLRYADPEMVERLFREARAQARIDHPCICKVYEVGEEDGLPYIAMQYVEGRQLHEAAENMSLEQKMLVVKHVSEAVQAAHSEGLIHRDLKPANIMVTETEDGELRPYVLDFGIAREQEVSGLTATGQILGTPGYLSPEQARGDSATLDRRTDIFSLGVILYELSSGSRPFEGDSNIEILVSLLEKEPDPLRTKAPALPRDLETVVMRCLEKDPERRYPSARELADDLGRFLDGEPVAARPVGLVEQLVRRARKNPLTTMAFAVAGIALLSLIVVAVGGWVKYTVDLKRERNAALEARAVAEASEAEAREVTDFLVSVFATSDPNESHGEVITAREILERGAERIERELGDRPEIQARLLGIMGEVYSRLGLFDRALPLLERALQQVLSLPGHSKESEIEARVRLADLCARRSDLDRAAEVVKPIPQMVASSPDLNPAAIVQALGCVGRVQGYRGHEVEARETMTRAVEFAKHELGPDSPLVGDLLSDTCFLSSRQSLWEQAIAECRRALEIREHAYGPDDPRVATTLNNLGISLQGAGRLEEAAEVGERVLEYRERVLGPEHPRTSTALNNLGLTYKKMGRLDRAEQCYLRSLEVRKKIYGEDHPRVGTVYNNLAGIYSDRKDFDNTGAMYLKALTIMETALGPDHPNIMYPLSGLAQVARVRGRHGEVERLSLRSLHIREASYGADSPKLIGCLRDLGQSRLALGKLDDAAGDLERARSIGIAAYGEDHERIAQIDTLLAEVEQARAGGTSE